MLTRKKFLAGSATAALAYSAIGRLSAEENHKMIHLPPLPKNINDAIKSSSDCIAKGDICKAHFVELLGKGSTDIYECMKSTTETVALCQSFMTLASQQSPLTKKLAGICIQACENCKKECTKHADHHRPCKDCADSCDECIKALKNL